MTETSPAGPAAARRGGDAIRLERLSRHYRMGEADVRALDDVSIAFARGSYTAIMGPSGSGKSTLLNVLGCLDRPTAGRYFLDGEDVAGFDDDRLSECRLRRLGFVFQSFNLIPELTVIENIELPLFYLGLDGARRLARAVELGGQVGLADRLHHRPAELSGGQRQRVAIARALANDPSVILADEPTGNLDTRTGLQILDLLTDLNRAGRTIVMVTHEADVAARARRSVHLRDGRIERIDEAAP
jgi:putative ABC transport system ATP-binding protein